MAKFNYLITGLSGTGKSSICNIMKMKGLDAIECDTEFGQHIDSISGQKDPQKKQDNWVWNRSKLTAVLVHKESEDLYLFGGSMNQHEFYDRFHKIFYLYCTNKTLIKRLDERLERRSSARTPQQVKDLEKQLEWNSNAIDYAKHKNFILIDAEQAISITADQIILLANINRHS